MFDLYEAFHTAFELIVTLDAQLLEIVLLSLWVSLTAVAIASLMGFAAGGAQEIIHY